MDDDPPQEHHLPADRGARPLVRAVRALESDARLDGAVAALEGPAAALGRAPALERELRGSALGHPLHPSMTDLPLGSWMSASILDLVGGRGSRRAAATLVGIGVAGSVPTVLTGLADWRHTGPAAKRVGAVHAAGNGVAILLYAASLAERLRGRHRRGVRLALAGAAVTAATGYLGGHLSFADRTGATDRPKGSSATGSAQPVPSSSP